MNDEMRWLQLESTFALPQSLMKSKILSLFQIASQDYPPPLLQKSTRMLVVFLVQILCVHLTFQNEMSTAKTQSKNNIFFHVMSLFTGLHVVSTSFSAVQRT